MSLSSKWKQECKQQMATRREYQSRQPKHGQNMGPWRHNCAVRQLSEVWWAGLRVPDVLARLECIALGRWEGGPVSLQTFRQRLHPQTGERIVHTAEGEK